MTDVVPAAWNADARSRAQTRGLLMALSRDRAAYFFGRPAVMLPLAIITFGFSPLLRRARSFLSVQRLEWSELQELASWLSAYTPLETEAVPLTRWADYWRATARRRSNEGAIATALIVSLALTAFLFMTYPSGPHRPGRDLQLPSDVWRFVLICVTAAWLLQFFRLTIHQWRLSGWFAALNRALAIREKRQVTLRASLWPALLLVGIPLAGAQLFSTWPIVLALILVTRLALFVHLREFRRARLQLIERLLEWMDDTGLPVEYDVVALNPDEIAAMIG